MPKTIVKTQILGQDEAQDLLQVAVKQDLPTLLVGETGTGKTSLIRELAELNKQTYTRFSITGETTVDDFVGKYILKNGETVWQDGILLSAVKGGHYLVVDEINAALPEILFVLHSLLDDDKYVIVPQKDNSLIKPHTGFRFFATMNPVEEYAGTKELNKAFMSRFAMVIEVEYPDRQTEVKIVTSRSQITESMANKMVDVAIGVRRAKEADKVFYTFSTRDLIYWAKLTKPLGIHRAFNVTIKNKGSGDGPVIEEVYRKVFSDYKKAETLKIPMNIEWYQDEYKRIQSLKADVRTEVRREVIESLKTDFDKVAKQKLAVLKEQTILKEMETRIKAQIKDGLKELL